MALTRGLPGAPAVRIWSDSCSIETGALDHCHRLGQGGDLHSADKIVNELNQRAAARGAEMNHRPAHRLEHRPRFFESLAGSADNEVEFASGCLGF